MVRMVIMWKAHPVNGVVIVDVSEIKTDGKKWLQCKIISLSYIG